MQWIFPMAGRGERTQNRGQYKPFITINKRMIVEWCLVGIQDHIQVDDSLIFITTTDVSKKYLVRETLSVLLEKLSINAKFHLVETPCVPNGPAATIACCFESLRLDQPCITVNCDQFTKFEMVSDLSPFDAFVPLYLSMNEKSSFVSIENGEISKLSEKERISYYATAGIYGFGAGEGLKFCIEEELSHGTPIKGEYYVASALNHLIKKGGVVKPSLTSFKFDLGDEPSIEAFEKVIDAFETALSTMDAFKSVLSNIK